MKTFAVILARGGSKGIPNKNLVEIMGKPLLFWTIRDALDSKIIEKVFVSSDDSEILKFSKNNGAIPIVRPKELSSNTASSESGWLHALSKIPEANQAPAFFALQATSPLRHPNDFDAAYTIFQQGQFDTLFSAEKIKDHYIWKQTIENIEPDNFKYSERAMRQSLETKYLENGSLYILNIKKFIHFKTRQFGKIGIYEMPNYKSFQIDELNDIDLANTLMKTFKHD